MEIKHVVVDASVLVDMFIETQQRHCLSQQLIKTLKSKNITLFVPMHAAFEVRCAIEKECEQRPDDVLSDKGPLKIKHIFLDNRFIENYWDLSIPYIKAGDLPYIMIAKKKDIPLITEDNKQKNVAMKSGVKAFGIKEFLEEMEG